MVTKYPSCADDAIPASGRQTTKVPFMPDLAGPNIAMSGRCPAANPSFLDHSLLRRLASLHEGSKITALVSAGNWLCFCNGPLIVKLKMYPSRRFRASVRGRREAATSCCRREVTEQSNERGLGISPGHCRATCLAISASRRRDLVGAEPRWPCFELLPSRVTRRWPYPCPCPR